MRNELYVQFVLVFDRTLGSIGTQIAKLGEQSNTFCLNVIDSNQLPIEGYSERAALC